MYCINKKGIHTNVSLLYNQNCRYIKYTILKVLDNKQENATKA